MARKDAKTNLERLFAAICKEQPSKADIQRLMDHLDRPATVEFLVSKLQTFIAQSDGEESWDSEFEWGVIHACRLLGEIRAETAVVSMIEIVDRLNDFPDTYLYNAAMIALEGAGAVALEPALERYERDHQDPERSSTWLWVLAKLGVTDSRVRQILLDHLSNDPREAVILMGDYGDRELLPVVESYVHSAAGYLNEHEIDPFAFGARFDDVVVSDYIDARESLVMLRDNIPVDHPQFDEKVETLDRHLLKYSVFSIYGDPPPGKSQ